MRVQEIMTPNVSCVTRDATLSDVARIMLDQDCGEVPIVGSIAQRDLLGVITDRDIVVRAVAKELYPTSTRVEEVMTDRVIVVHADTDAEECARIMSQNQIRRVPVVDEDNSVIGMVSTADISRSMDPTFVGEAMQDISQPDGAEFGGDTAASNARMAQQSGRQPGHPVI